MKVENIDRIALKESDIKQVYGETIFYRGQDYFDDFHLTFPLASDANMPKKQKAAKTMNAAFMLFRKTG
jgi:hypothetical protein